MQPDDRMTLLFADTLGEHPDTYRFLEAAVEDLTADGADYIRLADGQNHLGSLPRQEISRKFSDRSLLKNPET